MYRNCSQSSIGIINFHFLSNFVWLTFGSLVLWVRYLYIYVVYLVLCLFACLVYFFDGYIYNLFVFVCLLL